MSNCITWFITFTFYIYVLLIIFSRNLLLREGENLNNPLSLFRKQKRFFTILFRTHENILFWVTLPAAGMALPGLCDLLTFALHTGRSAELKCKLETAVIYLTQNELCFTLNLVVG